MYTIIEDSSEIKRAEEKFKKAFEKLWDRSEWEGQILQ